MNYDYELRYELRLRSNCDSTSRIKWEFLKYQDRLLLLLLFGRGTKYLILNI